MLASPARQPGQPAAAGQQPPVPARTRRWPTVRVAASSVPSRP